MKNTYTEPNDVQSLRVDQILRKCVQEYELDLRGLTVYTEAASGPYLYTPIMAALAGAQKVYAITADSRFGTKEDIQRKTLEAALRWKVDDKLVVIFEKTEKEVGRCDIITNSGFVRPITRDMISWMKPTAVIPLMWETWEFRDSEVDLSACEQHGVLVMGTDESKPPLSMYPYSGYLAMKLLFELGLEGYKTKVILLGSGNGLGRSIFQHFKRLGIEVVWFSGSHDESLSYEIFPDYFEKYGGQYDVILLAEHERSFCLLGENGLLSFDRIKQVNPCVCVGIIAGNVDIDGLYRSGIFYYPKEVRPFGYMTYQPYHLGVRPVLELYAAGLKVGQVMARARLNGFTVEEAARYALKNSLAMDFNRSKLWR